MASHCTSWERSNSSSSSSCWDTHCRHPWGSIHSSGSIQAAGISGRYLRGSTCAAAIARQVCAAISRCCAGSSTSASSMHAVHSSNRRVPGYQPATSRLQQHRQH
jgi:hypothetical protein